jgi:hypothetical protein
MSNKLFAQKETFLNGYFSKPGGIQKTTNISKIEIKNNSVVFTCRDSLTKLLYSKVEKRSITLEIFNFGVFTLSF